MPGILIGSRGKREINPTIRVLVDAVYQVLAGGKVTETAPNTLTVSPGALAQVKEYRTMEDDCMNAINLINSGQPYNLVAEV